MLITKYMEVNLVASNIPYFESKGYYIPREKNSSGRIAVKKGTTIIVKTEDLKENSGLKVMVKCDCEKCCTPIKNPIRWVDYKKNVKCDGKYYCHDCAIKIFGIKNMLSTVLQNSKSFEQWCIDNNRQDVLDRWDYDLNDNKPSEICYRSSKKYWFKCASGIHKSELKNICNFVKFKNGVINCKQCNSFAQWGINTFGDDFIEKYWDYEKNNDINPWSIDKSSKNKVFVICQNKSYHMSYKTSCNDFFSGKRCPYCKNIKIHMLDSLGTLYPQVLNVWSDKNNKSPYEYAPNSNQKVWFKCNNNKHKDYYRRINGSNINDFSCNLCNISRGEKSIETNLIYNDIFFEAQKEFKGLIGLGNGLLSYDFYLPDYNLLIEFQGEQHEKYIKGLHKTKKDFEKQQEHDRRKKQFTIDNNIKLLEIWYWDFDRIKEILSQELNFMEINN